MLNIMVSRRCAVLSDMHLLFTSACCIVGMVSPFAQVGTRTACSIGSAMLAQHPVQHMCESDQTAVWHVLPLEGMHRPGRADVSLTQPPCSRARTFGHTVLEGCSHVPSGLMLPQQLVGALSTLQAF